MAMVEQQDEDQQTGTLSLEHYLGIVRRRHLQFLLPLFLVWAAVWGASWVLPPKYQSTTLILVSQPTMPTEYVKPNVNEDMQDRLQSITQQILSRTRLLSIIDQYNLYSGKQHPVSPDDKVERMRKDINLELVRDGGNQITAFNVSYLAPDPHTAQKVTGDLTNLFIHENLEVQQTESVDTTKFLESQLETARQALAQQEDKIRQFKALHPGEMPEQLQSNLQILSGLQAQLQSDEDSLGTAKQQGVYLQTLLDQSRAMQGSTKTSDGTSVGLPALNEELDKLKAQLADLSSHYTDRHPDVRKLKEQIAKTEKMRDQLLAAPKVKDPDATASTPDPSQNAATANIQSQLHANQVEAASRERSITEIKAKIEDYQGRLNQEPIREQELADLTRGYEQSKENYDDLLKKKNGSSLATNMVIMQQGERFTVVDPPSLPAKPEFPNRLKFCGFGLALGIAFGAVVAGAFEMKDDRVHGEKELKALLPSMIIAEIPAIINDADQRRAQRGMWLGWAVAALVGVTILAGSAFSYLRG